MIKATRKKHRLAWTALAILLPLVFAASIIFRHEEPLNEKIPRKAGAEVKKQGESR